MLTARIAATFVGSCRSVCSTNYALFRQIPVSSALRFDGCLQQNTWIPQCHRRFLNTQPLYDIRSNKHFICGLLKDPSPFSLNIQNSFYRTSTLKHKEPRNGGDKPKNKGEDGTAKIDSAAENVAEEKLTVFQRFKKAYREHGKILIGVHLVTSAAWFGTFFYAAKSGVDIIPLLEKWGVNEKVINPFRSSDLGSIALAYLMYKLATPARYTVTLGGTNLVIRYFRKTGRMQPMGQGQSLRELYKDGRIQIRHSHKRIRSELRKQRVERIHKIKAAAKRKS